MRTREPIYFWDDSHLAELIRDAERARKFNKMSALMNNVRRFATRINWGPILGGLIVIGVSGLAWWALIEAVIYANGWYQ